MFSPRLTVVLPLRNRAGVRLDNCLRSLRWQEGVDRCDVEILISDFGSEPAFRDEVATLARTHEARVVFTPAPGVWNRSRALNIGIRQSRGALTLSTDVDMVFATNFLRTILDVQTEAASRALALCQCYDLGPETLGRVIDREELDALRDGATLRPAYGLGGCQATTTAWFHRARGFDERMTFWGAEDKDLAFRARRDGLALTWLNDRTFMLHQWHETLKHERPWLTKKNRWRFKLTNWIVRKNWLGWGR
jgi:glycosyltransferase involved in cell wall biosynthesis